MKLNKDNVHLQISIGEQNTLSVKIKESYKEMSVYTSSLLVTVRRLYV